MEPHILMLHVTDEQERAIELLFIENQWIFSKAELRNPSQQDLTTSCSNRLSDISVKVKELNDLPYPTYENMCYKSTEREDANNPRSAMAIQESSLMLHNQNLAENLKQLCELDFCKSYKNFKDSEINDLCHPQAMSSQHKDTSISDHSSLSENEDFSIEKDKTVHHDPDKKLLSRRELYIDTGQSVINSLGKLNYICAQKTSYTRDEYELINGILSKLFSMSSECIGTSAQRASETLPVQSWNILLDENNCKTEEKNPMQYHCINPSNGSNTHLRDLEEKLTRSENEKKIDNLIVERNTPASGTANKKSGKTSRSQRVQKPKIRKQKYSTEKVKKLPKKNKRLSSEKRKSKQQIFNEISCDDMGINDTDEESRSGFCNEGSKINTIEQDMNLGEKAGQIIEKTEFLCDLCGAKFSEKKVLNGHRKYVHTEDRPEQCEICDKRFKTKSQLANHKLVHKSELELDLSCEVCGKRFRRAGTLKDHVRRHKKDYSEFCMICGKGFYRNYWLQEHMKTHSGLKPYECKICGFKTALKCNLNKHIKTHRT